MKANLKDHHHEIATHSRIIANHELGLHRSFRSILSVRPVGAYYVPTFVPGIAPRSHVGGSGKR